MLLREIEVIVWLLALAFCIYLFFELIYPIFSRTKKIGWILFRKEKPTQNKPKVTPIKSKRK